MVTVRAADELVEATTEARGDFESVFRTEYPRLVRALYLLTGDAAEAEDVAQEALARAFERWEWVRRMDKPVGYVYRVALNVHRRRRWRVSRMPAPDPPAPASDPAESAATRSDVLDGLLALPITLRQTLILHEWLGLNSEEAGRILGIRPGSVRARLHRARRALRDRLGEGYERRS